MRFARFLLVMASPALASMLKPFDTKIDPLKCMGTWYVQRAIPAVAALEKGAHNGCEVYEWDADKERIDVTYTFNAGGFDGALRTVTQYGWIAEDNALGTSWKVRPKVGPVAIPVKLPFTIIDVDASDYSYLSCSGGLNSWMYIMTRERQPDPALIARLERSVAGLGFDMSKVLAIPHEGK